MSDLLVWSSKERFGGNHQSIALSHSSVALTQLYKPRRSDNILITALPLELHIPRVINCSFVIRSPQVMRFSLLDDTQFDMPINSEIYNIYNKAFIVRFFFSIRWLKFPSKFNIHLASGSVNINCTYRVAKSLYWLQQQE